MQLGRGGGKKTRQKYPPDLPKTFASALREHAAFVRELFWGDGVERRADADVEAPADGGNGDAAVSYTHLTLPTILLV